MAAIDAQVSTGLVGLDRVFRGVMAVFSIKEQTYQAFTGGPVGFDAVLGARGSQLQLVLNTVFHLETSPGNIPYSMYTAISADPGVELAIPYAVGDNYEGYRVVGTIPDLFTRFEYTAGRKLSVAPGGRVFTMNCLLYTSRGTGVQRR